MSSRTVFRISTDVCMKVSLWSTMIMCENDQSCAQGTTLCACDDRHIFAFELKKFYCTFSSESQL